MFKIKFTQEALSQLNQLKKAGLNDKLRKIKTALDKLQENPRHPGLHTHKNETFKTFYKGEVFQSYAENRTPAAYRIFWHYGPDDKDITILTIIQHP